MSMCKQKAKRDKSAREGVQKDEKGLILVRLLYIRICIYSKRMLQAYGGRVRVASVKPATAWTSA